MAEVIQARRFAGRKVTLTSIVIAVIGFVLLAVGLLVDPARTWLSYLMAFVFVFTLSVGGLILLMSGYATNARWMSVIRRPTEAVALALPAIAVLFVPLMFGLDSLYPWRTRSPELGHHALAALAHREPYMNTAFFLIRAVIYFAVLLIASWTLRRWSVRRDLDPDRGPIADPEAALKRERMFASGMLPPVALAFTFAAMDWVMALEPVWYSTMFGFYAFAGGFLGALGLVTVFAYRMWTANAAGGAITRHHFHALGRLLLAFVIFWAYIAYFQAMLIRIANKPEEVTFYLERIYGAWGVLVWILIIGHFVLPFLLLLLRSPKFRPRVMAATGWWLVLMHLVDVYWLVIPSHVQGVMVFHWLDLAALAAVGGTAVAVASWRQTNVLLVPERDPFVRAGAAYWSKV